VAERLFGGDDPVGRRIRRTDTRGRASAREYEVVGVVGDVPGARIEDGASPMVYYPVLPDGDRLPRDSFPLPIVPRGAQYVVRSETPISAASVRAALQSLDRRVPPMQIQPMSAYVDAAMSRVRLTMLLLAVASAGALILGVIGVYTVVAYAAAGRLREFGVRLALGATPMRVAGLVWREGALLAALGVGVGLLLAAAGTRVLRSLLFEVSATSVLEFGVALLIVVAVTLVATTLPARRAGRTDPALVLRGE
jgi:cell division protein FtsX